MPDPEFVARMRAEARGVMEAGTVAILAETGMHRSSLAALTPASLQPVGAAPDRPPRWFLYWVAPKAQRKERSLRARVPEADVPVVREWLGRCSGRTGDYYYRVVVEVGRRAGYPGVSPMTFRHQRVVALLRRGVDPVLVSHLTGATLATIEKHYAQAAPGLYADEEPVEREKGA